MTLPVFIETVTSNPSAMCGKGLFIQKTRFYGSPPSKPIVGMAPLDTDWASPSVDDIHVSDTKEEARFVYNKLGMTFALAIQEQPNLRM